MLRVKASVLVHQLIEEVFRFVATDFKADRRSEIPFHITQDEPYHAFSWERDPDDSPGMRALYEHVRYMFYPIAGETQVTCEQELSLGRGFTRKLVEWYIFIPARAYVKQCVANLKKMLEDPAAATPNGEGTG